MRSRLYDRPNGLSRREFLRLTGAGLAGATLLGAAGCGGGGGTEKGKLRVAFFGSREVAQAQNALVPPFKEKVPEVKDVEFIPIQGTDWEEFFGKVLTQLAAGDPPDITFVATEGTQLFAAEGIAVPLDEYVERDKREMSEYFSDVHPALVEATMYEGSLYELPIDFNAANMYYNVELLEEAGVGRPSPGWTKDDFYNLVSQWKNEEVAGYNWVNRLWGSWTPWMFNNGTNLLTEERAPGGSWLWDTFYGGDPAAEGRGGGWRWPEPNANDPANVEALQFMVDLQNEGIAPKPDLGGGDELQGFFANGKIAMTPGGGFWAGGLQAAGMEKGTYDVQFFPEWKSQRHLFGTAGYMIMEQSSNKDLAWEFIKHLSSKESMNIDLEGNVSTPTRKSMMTQQRYSSTGPEHWEVFYDTLTKYPDTAPIPSPPESNPMTTAFTRRTSEAVTGGKTPKEALDALQLDFEDLYAKREG
ncbi:MAG: ABC transporter substrate-binding protein [Rubrobacter sp.]